MNQAKVSILIPTYNKHHLIQQCVESALLQDYSNLEIIVSDDSDNNFVEIELKELIQKGQIKYFRNCPRLGRLENYNRLLKEYSTGEWILMMDGDDFLSKNTYISEAMNWISNREEEIVYVRARHSIDIPKVENNISEFICVDGKKYINNPFIYCSEFSHLTSIYNRKLAIDSEFYRYNDLYGFLILSTKGKVGLCNSMVGVWRNIKESESKSIKDEDIRNIFGMITDPDSKLRSLMNFKVLKRYKLYYYLNYLIFLQIYPKNSRIDDLKRIESLACINDFFGKILVQISKFLNLFYLKKFISLVKLIY